MMKNRLLLVVLIVGVIWAATIPMASTASTVRRKDIKETGITNQNKVYGHVRKRDLTDREMAAKLANFVVDKAARSRRDEMRPLRRNLGLSSVEIKQHVMKAEADAIAAAEESSAAEKHAKDAIAETEEAEQEIATFEENDAGEMVSVPDKESHRGHGHENDHHAQLNDLIGGLESRSGSEHRRHGHETDHVSHESRGGSEHGRQGHETDHVSHESGGGSEHGRQGHETDHVSHESGGGSEHGRQGHETDHVSHESDLTEGRSAGRHHGHKTDQHTQLDDLIGGLESRGGSEHGQQGHETDQRHHDSDLIEGHERNPGHHHGHGDVENHHTDDTRHEASSGGGYEKDEISHFHGQESGLHHTGDTSHGHDKTESEYDSSDMVHVADIEQGHGHGFESSDNDMVHVADIEHTQDNFHGHGHSSSDLEEQSISSDHIFGENLDDQGIGEPSDLGAGSVESSGHHDDVETPLNTLLTQSKDLAKETQLVFQVIARREDFLVKEMESFKKALQDAIQVLQDTAKENKQRFKRWDSGNAEPYKACVYVTPGEGPKPQSRSEYTPPERYVQEQQYVPPPVPEPEVAPLPPPPPPPIPVEPLPQTGAQYQPQGDDIDLSSVYWLKLPQNEDESSLDKVQRVLGEVRSSGRDILLIPVLKGFTDVNDLARGFLRSVRVNPAAVQSANKNSRRRRFRLRIRRLL